MTPRPPARPLVRLARPLLAGAVLAAALAAATPVHASSSPDGPAVPYGQPGGFLPMSGLLAVGDVDGNGVKDVIETRQLPALEGRLRDVGIIARDGRRGVELWRRTVRLEGHEGMYLTALRRAGSNRPLALMTIEGGRHVDGRTYQTRRLLGLDLRTNAFVWRARFDDVSYGGKEGSGRCAPCTRTVGLVPAASGPGQDVLLTTIRSRPAQTGPPAYDGGPPRELTPPADVQLRRLQTATGAVANVGGTFLTDQPDPQPEVTPDLDGDRRDDVLLRGETGRTLTAVSSATGAVRWRSERLPYSTGISRAHADASGRRDLIVPTFAGTTSDDYDQRPVYTDPQVALVDAATGQVRWRRGGVQAQPIAAGAGLPLVAVLDLSLSKGSTSTSTATVTAVDPAGLPRWTTRSTLSSSAPGAELNALDNGGLQDVGDTDGDGQRESLLVHELFDGGASPKRTSKVVDGATGVVSADLGRQALPLLAPLRGAAPDLVTTAPKVNGQPLVLLGLDGSGGAPLWRRALPGTTGATRFAAVDAVRLVGTGCRHLLVTGYPRLVHSVVSGAGLPAWTVVPSTTSLYGGQLIPGTFSSSGC